MAFHCGYICAAIWEIRQEISVRKLKTQSRKEERRKILQSDYQELFRDEKQFTSKNLTQFENKIRKTLHQMDLPRWRREDFLEAFSSKSWKNLSHSDRKKHTQQVVG